MKTIPISEYEKLMLVQFENERLIAENLFLHKKITEYQLKFKENEIIEMAFLNSKRIDSLDLSVRAINILHENNIITLGDLKCFIDKNGNRKLLRLRNMGKISYYQVMDVIFHFNLLNKN